MEGDLEREIDGELEREQEMGAGEGAIVFIQSAGVNSSQVSGGAGVYGQGVGVHRQNQKLGIAQVKV